MKEKNLTDGWLHLRLWRTDRRFELTELIAVACERVLRALAAINQWRWLAHDSQVLF